MISWMRRGTLRARLAIWYSVGGILLLAAFSGTVYWFVAQRLARPLDYHLRKNVAEIKMRLSVSADGEILWDQKPAKEQSTWTENDPWFELWDPADKLIVRLWPLDETQLKRHPTPPVRNRETISIFRVADDTRLRVLSVPFDVPGSAQPWMLRVIRIHRPAVEALGALLKIIVVASPVVVALLVFGGYAITRHWLRPLDSLVAATTRISAENLTTRLPVSNPNDELGQLATAFNKTLGRLEGSFTTLDSFVADASHELRTPLTALRNVGEVGLSYDRTPAEYREIIGSMLEESQRLQQLVDRLLQLARAEGGGQVLALQPQRLDEIAAQSIEELRVLAEEKEQQLLLKLDECTANTDALLVRQAFQNLLDNAIKYSPIGAVITVEVTNQASCSEMIVSDNGPGIAPAQREQLTNRFFRCDGSRARSRGGYGLGLAITKAHMLALGGSLEFEPVEPHGCRFRLTFPRVKNAQRAATTIESPEANRKPLAT